MVDGCIAIAVTDKQVTGWRKGHTCRFIKGRRGPPYGPHSHEKGPPLVKRDIRRHVFSHSLAFPPDIRVKPAVTWNSRRTDIADQLPVLADFPEHMHGHVHAQQRIFRSYAEGMGFFKQPLSKILYIISFRVQHHDGVVHIPCG